MHSFALNQIVVLDRTCTLAHTPASSLLISHGERWLVLSGERPGESFINVQSVKTGKRFYGIHHARFKAEPAPARRMTASELYADMVRLFPSLHGRGVFVTPAEQDARRAAFKAHHEAKPAAPKQFIIAVLKDGKPAPSTEPKVFTSRVQAETVSRIMAEKNLGEVFVVFEAVAASVLPKKSATTIAL